MYNNMFALILAYVDEILSNVCECFFENLVKNTLFRFKTLKKCVNLADLEHKLK